VVGEDSLNNLDVDEAASRVLRDREPVFIVRRVPLDTRLRVPGAGSHAHPWAGCTLRLRVELLADETMKLNCMYPSVCPVVMFREPVPVHLGVVQALLDRGSLQLETAFRRRVQRHKVGAWGGRSNLAQVAMMAWEVITGSNHAQDSVSGLDIAREKVAALLRLMERSSASLRLEWRRRSKLLLWRATCIPPTKSYQSTIEGPSA